MQKTSGMCDYVLFIRVGYSDLNLFQIKKLLVIQSQQITHASSISGKSVDISSTERQFRMDIRLYIMANIFQGARVKDSLKLCIFLLIDRMIRRYCESIQEKESAGRLDL